MTDTAFSKSSGEPRPDLVSNFDHLICMSRMHFDALRLVSEQKVSLFEPGIDLDLLAPKIRIGIVEESSGVERKNEHLISALMDLSGIDWRFWTTSRTSLTDEISSRRRAQFYHSLDYVLVLSSEGQEAMSAREALACGRSVITSGSSSNDDNTLLLFEDGNPESLRKILNGLISKRDEVRSRVAGETWEKWAENHLSLFEKLLSAQPAFTKRSLPARTDLSAILITHGGEEKSRGGPSVRVPRTVKELNARGCRAYNLSTTDVIPRDLDIAHVYNIWPPESALSTLKSAKVRGLKTVFSPIYMDLSDWKQFMEVAPDVLSLPSKIEIDIGLRALRERLEGRVANSEEIYPGFHSDILACADLSDAIICLSELEKNLLVKIGVDEKKVSVVRNPVDVSGFASADPGIAVEHLNSRDFILCVGRIEARKNQLLLAEAAARLERRAVFVGHVGDADYARKVREAAGGFGTFLDRVDYDNPLLASLYKACTVFCLPSWVEGAPLSALEAAAAGRPLILGNQASENEYFSDCSAFVHPADLDGLLHMIHEFPARWQREGLIRRQKEVVQELSWENHAEATLDVYEGVLSDRSEAPTDSEREHNGIIYFDITAAVDSGCYATDAGRVQQALHVELRRLLGEKLILIYWSEKRGVFCQIDDISLIFGSRAPKAEAQQSQDFRQMRFGDFLFGATYVVMGDGWPTGAVYCDALIRLRIHSQLKMMISVFGPFGALGVNSSPTEMFDLINQHAINLLRNLDAIVVYSEAARKEMMSCMAKLGYSLLPVEMIRLGDRLVSLRDGEDMQVALISQLLSTNFALSVSSIGSSENDAMLIEVWRRLCFEDGEDSFSLVLIGPLSRAAEELMRALTNDETFSMLIHHFEHVNDATIDWMYRNCHFTLYPAKIDDCAISVAQSLSYGKPCVASDLESTRMVGQGLAELIDPYDFSGWLSAVRRCIRLPNLCQRSGELIAESFEPTLWSQAAKKLSHVADMLANSSYQHNEKFTEGARILSKSSETNEAARYLADGWRYVPNLGYFLRPSRPAYLTVPVSREDYWCRIELDCADPHTPGSVHVEVRFDGRCQARSDVDHLFVVDFRVPAKGDSSWQRRKLEVILSDGATEDYCELEVRVRAIAIASRRKNLAKMIASVGAGIQPIFTNENSEDTILKRIKRNTLMPQRLPRSGRVFKLLRFLQVDRVAIRLYEKTFSRTNDSIKSIVRLINSRER
ncbi:MAG: glycosyltransferase [Pseudomonadota bacterium]